MFRLISILVVSSMFYFVFVKPLRLLINENIFLPTLNFLLFNYDVAIPQLNHTEVLISSLDNNNKVLFRMPFNGFYIVPSILMILENKIDLLKIYTLIHLGIIFIPLLMFLIGLNFTILFNDFFQRLFIFISLVITILLFSQMNFKE